MNARLMVVDDDASIRETFALHFASRYDVSVAVDGTAALSDVGRFDPDLVITDLRMPGLNGCELARRISAIHPSVRVLLVSAADPEHLEPGWPFVRKPFSPEALLRAVEQLVGPSPRGRAG